jgi:NAD(P)-dependent dehydrogenase (short-subunit alcohol dehydrogenase family)
MDFTGKTVLVTGASRGIGRAIAQAFASKGAQVGVHYHRNEGAARETLKSIPGDFHDIFCCDISDASQSKPLVDEVIDRFGGIDILVNNAGVHKPHPVQDVEYHEWLDAWQLILATNLLGPANLMYWVIQHMLERGGGRIVNISSRGAFRGEPTNPAYGASKAGLNALSQSLAQALAPNNIFITVVAPGFVDAGMATERLSGPDGDSIRAQSPLGRVAKPEEVAHTVLFLASEGSDFLTGAIVDVNGASYLRS